MIAATVDTGVLRHVTVVRGKLMRGFVKSLKKAITQAQKDGIKAVIFDMSAIRSLRATEIGRVIDLAADTRRTLEIGIAADAVIVKQFQDLKADRVLTFGLCRKEIEGQTCFATLKHNGFHAVVLAGCDVPLLGPLTADRPAALLEFTGETLLKRCLDRLYQAGFRSATLCLGDRSEQVRDVARRMVRDDFQLLFSVSKSAAPNRFEQLSTAYQCGFGWNKPVLVLDTLTLNFACPSKLVDGYLGSTSKGIVHQNNGVFGGAVLDADLLQNAHMLSRSELVQGISRCAGAENVVVDDFGENSCVSVRNASGFFEAQVQLWVENQRGDLGYQRHLSGAWVHRSARVHPSAQLSATSVVGPAVDVARNAVLSGDVVLARGAKLHPNCFLEQTWVGEGCSVPSGCWAQDKLVGMGWAIDHKYSTSLPLNVAALEGVSTNPAGTSGHDLPAVKIAQTG